MSGSLYKIFVELHQRNNSLASKNSWVWKIKTIMPALQLQLTIGVITRHFIGVALCIIVFFGPKLWWDILPDDTTRMIG